MSHNGPLATDNGKCAFESTTRSSTLAQLSFESLFAISEGNDGSFKIM
jgi:hypothetical protein